MNLCNFRATAVEGLIKCSACGQEMRTKSPPERAFAKCDRPVDSSQSRLTIGQRFVRLCGCKKLHATWKDRIDELDQVGWSAWENERELASEFAKLADDASVDRSGFPISAMIRRAKLRHAAAAEKEEGEPSFDVNGIIRKSGSGPVTIGVTYYRRPKAYKRLLASIDKFYPGLPVVTVNTLGNLSEARNRLRDAIDTEFIFLVEEDMTFTEKTDVGLCLEILQHDRFISGVGGIATEKHRGKVRWLHNFKVVDNKSYIEPSRRPVRETPSGVKYRPCDLILNFGLFRRHAWKECPWDADIPIMEHQEHFYRASSMGQEYAFCDRLECFHHRDRPSPEYKIERERNFAYVAKRKLGLQKFNTIKQKAPAIATPPKPNLIVIGTGSSNSTITMRQLESLGWNVGHADREFMEQRELLRINAVVKNQGQLPVERAEKFLASMPRPFALKDPRLCETMHYWVPLFRQYDPVLVWIEKDLDYVIDSYKRRWGSDETLPRRRYRACQRQFDRWQGPKVKIDAEKIANAVALFDLGRTPVNAEAAN